MQSPRNPQNLAKKELYSIVQNIVKRVQNPRKHDIVRCLGWGIPCESQNPRNRGWVICINGDIGVERSRARVIPRIIAYSLRQFQIAEDGK